MRKKVSVFLVVVILFGNIFLGNNIVYADDGTPYVTMNLPCTIQAEDFNNGVQGVAYYDTTSGNTGGVYRTNADVDIASISGGYCVGWGENGEWLNYTVNNLNYGRYNISIRAATAYANMGIRVYVDGRAYGPYEVAGNGNLAFGDVAGPLVGLSAGAHVIKISIISPATGNCLNIDSISVSYVDAGLTWVDYGIPYKTMNLPCIIESEDFNNGGQGISYNDITPGNSGNVYRPVQDVDIAAITGGYCIGWGEDGEWLRYTASNSSYGRYKVTFKAATAYPDAAVRIDIDGKSYGPYRVPNNGNLGFTDIEGPLVSLAPGSHTFTLFINSVAYGNVINIDYMNITLQDTDLTGFTRLYEAENGAFSGSPLPQLSMVYKNYTGSGFVAWWNSEGQSDQITVNVPATGKYKLTYKYSAPVGASRAIYVNGVRIVDNLSFTKTINWKSWWTESFIVDLSPGNNTIKCIYEGAYGSSGAINIDNLRVDYVGNITYNGSHNIPGRVQAEDFDLGSNGISYYDTTADNAGGSYRTDVDVDMAVVGSEGNVVGWMANGEWLKYTVYSAETKNYDMTLRVDSITTGNKLKVYVDDNEVGEHTLPKTGDTWGTYSNMSGPQKLLLTKGYHVIKFKVTTGNVVYNINWFELNSSFDITPGIYSSGLGSGDVIAYTLKVTDYGALPDSNTDATSAFQNALDTVESLGGGVVFVPAGKYRINGHLNIGSNVTLRGEWKSPDSNGLGLGTILEAYENKGNENGEALLKMNRSSGVTNLGIWYPEQDYSNVQSYPYSIQGNASQQDVLTIENITLYNSYNGIQIGQYSTWNGINKIKNIYGTVLKTGIKENFTADVTRFENININTTYWSNSGLTNAPSSSSAQTSLKNYTRANAIAFFLYRLDWCWMYKINLSDLLYGMYMNGGSNIGASYVNISNVNVGMKIDSMIPPGVQLSYSTINASVGTEPIGILINCPTIVINVSSTTIGGTPHTGIRITGTDAVLNCNNVTFEDWGYNGGIYAIDSQKGALNIQKCNFQQNKSHIHISSATTGAVILSNTFTGAPQITNQSSGNVVINNNMLDIPTQPAYNYIFPTKKKPANVNNFYNVKSSPYNATGNGITDDTPSIQAALTTAGNNGGGTVYLPAGKYKVNTYLEVPSGVELRGCFDVVHSGFENTWSKNEYSGTQIEAYGGKGNADGTPLIKLNANSGVKGLSIFYPEQDFDNVYAYPWAVRGFGDGCWVENISFVNAYLGIDMNTYKCNNHLISSNTGFGIDTSVYVGKGVTDGYIEDNHFNPTSWVFGNRPGTPVGDYAGDLFNNTLLNNAKGYIFGACSSTYNNFQNFCIITKEAFTFLGQAEGNYSGTVYCPGLDATKNGLKVDSGGTINVLHIMASCAYSDSVGVINTTSNFTGNLNIYNWASWVGYTKIATLNGGNVSFVLYNANNSYNCKVNGGTFKSYGSVYMRYGVPSTINDMEFGSSIISATVMGNLGKGSLNIIDNSGGRLTSSYNAAY